MGDSGRERCITDAPRWGCVTSNHVVPRGTGVRLLLRCGFLTEWSKYLECDGGYEIWKDATEDMIVNCMRPNRTPPPLAPFEKAL